MPLWCGVVRRGPGLAQMQGTPPVYRRRTPHPGDPASSVRTACNRNRSSGAPRGGAFKMRSLSLSLSLFPSPTGPWLMREAIRWLSEESRVHSLLDTF